MNQLIEDYERRLKTIREELKVPTISLQKEMRLGIKAGCYKTFIAELKRQVKASKPLDMLFVELEVIEQKINNIDKDALIEWNLKKIENEDELKEPDYFR